MYTCLDSAVVYILTIRVCNFNMNEFTFQCLKLPVCTLMFCCSQGAFAESYSCRVAAYTICARLKHTHTKCIHTFVFRTPFSLLCVCSGIYSKCSCACAVIGSQLFSHRAYSNGAVAMAAQSFLLNHPSPLEPYKWSGPYSCLEVAIARAVCTTKKIRNFSRVQMSCGSGERICARLSA